MRIIAKRTLREFWERHPDAQQALETWYDDTKQAMWRTPSDIKRIYKNASILPNNRVVFNIKGNTYRLVIAMNYAYGITYIRFIGTHHEYDQIDATII
jgi:mRNA interferase HigB